MAKAPAKIEEAQVSLASAKVKRLIIKNFRCIGSKPVEIDLDDIVVLVGPNNAGKSTILRAYEVVMAHGSVEGRLAIDDYPQEKCDPDCVPEIELQTYVSDDLPGKQWLHSEPETDRIYIRERWRWEEVGKDPKRQGRRADAEDWDEKVPWGAPSIAKSRRPIPHRVDAFSSPDEQGKKITQLLSDILLEKARSKGGDEASAIDQLTDQIRDLQRRIVKDSEAEIQGLETSLSDYLGEIFVGFKVRLDARTETVDEKHLNVFKTSPLIRMGPEDGHLSPLEKQGSGARRTLLWSALKIASERSGETAKKSTKPKTTKSAETGAETENEPIYSRPHVLLLDEPEICLHPNAVREACRVLYDLAKGGTGWQVMVTTHSPAFLDISRDNTTIVRVERATSGDIMSTTVFKPEKVKLTDDEKLTLKYMNQWDPYVAEFFFGGRTVLVEGDTEYSAFREIVERDRKTYRDVHIVRARGKYIIPILGKIMNHFGGKYAVLHDTDRRENANGSANSAWAANEQIRVVTSSAQAGRVRLAASVVDFEHAIFGKGATKDKPFNTVRQIREDFDARNRAEKVLKYLLFEDENPPLQTIIAWNSEADLDDALAKFDDGKIKP